MSTPIEKDLSPNNKWYVGKARRQELRYFVKQYQIWINALTDLNLYYASVPREARYDIPYGRDLFYDKVRQFIWTLDKLRK